LRAVLDVNVIVSALLSSRGAPAAILREWTRGAFELVVSPLLLEELRRTLAYPKLRRSIGAEEAAEVIAWLRASAELVPDPDGPPPTRSSDPADDYLLALAAAERTVVVSGDKHLLALRQSAPIFTAAEFAAMLER
jgi:putative PIN family toxin of toxin-antitoxin system